MLGNYGKKSVKSNSIQLLSQISETFFFRNELVSRFFILYNNNNIIISFTK